MIFFQDFFFYIQNIFAMILSNICFILKLVNDTHNIVSDIIVDSTDMYILCCKFFDVQLIMISSEILWNWWLVYFLHHVFKMHFISVRKVQKYCLWKSWNQNHSHFSHKKINHNQKILYTKKADFNMFCIQLNESQDTKSDAFNYYFWS